MFKNAIPSRTSDLRSFNDVHTGAKIREAVTDVLSSFGISVEDVCRFVTDNASNMIKAFENEFAYALQDSPEESEDFEVRALPLGALEEEADSDVEDNDDDMSEDDDEQLLHELNS